MWLRIGCDLTFDVSMDTPFILMLRPRSGARQWVSREFYTLKPVIPAFEFTDNYGNLCQRLVAPPGEFRIQTSADVLTADNIDRCPGAPFEVVIHLPVDVLPFLLPSRYCESDRFMKMATEIVAGTTPGYDQVAAIVEWIKGNIHFNPASLYFQLSAVEVNQRREGVCRELAHLGIALCRGLSIPARMAVGYLHGIEPLDFHAWFEAYVGGQWYVFDPVRFDPSCGRVTVAYGRDAADVAIFNQFGPTLFPREMSVHIEKLDGPPAYEI